MKFVLIIEKNKGKLWGRVYYKDNMIVEQAATIETLERKMHKLLRDFHKIKTVYFDHSYDLTVFFEKFDFLKQSKIAELTGMNPGLLRQYASGVKHPSLTQAKKIEAAVHTLAKELRSISLHAEA
jgi:hypothetical protein